MAKSSSFIPDLGSRPPSVDFIENRMPKYSLAFETSSLHYNAASQQFVPTERRESDLREPIISRVIQNDAIEQEFSPIDQPMALDTSLSTNIKAMKYWDEIFSDAITQLQTTAEPKIKNPELRIRYDKGWDTIYLKLEKARSGYLKQGGRFGEVVRKFADHTTSATVLVKIAQDVTASNQCSTPVLGAVQLILNVNIYFYQLMFTLLTKTFRPCKYRLTPKLGHSMLLRTLARCLQRLNYFYQNFLPSNM